MNVSKDELDQVYALGYRHGQIEMRNKVLKYINRDWNLLPHADVMIKVMKKIQALRLSNPKLSDKE